jgi:hypothetical protein
MTKGHWCDEKGLYIKGSLVNWIIAQGRKPSKTARLVDENLPFLTRDELDKVRDWIARDALMRPDTDPEWRRQLLSEMDVCPCCERWLGHNKPPADDGDSDPPYRRQPSFDFKR